MTAYRGRPGRLVRWLVIGPAAVAALTAILVGGPVLLLRLGGNPVPDRLPAPGELLDLLTRPDDGSLLLWALSLVGWGAWAVVAGSLLLELGAQLTGRRTPQLPGLAGPQRLASVLVASVLAALTAPGIGHAHAAYLDGAPTVAVTAGPPASDIGPAGLAPGPAWLAPGPAERASGPAERASGPAEVAPGPAEAAPRPAERASGPAEVAPGPAEAAPGPPEAPPGPTGTTAAGATRSVGQSQPLVHEVAKGDWMWHIAGRYLGDERRYPEIARLNPEYDRRYADYPDHIQPGDRLVLPADAYDRGERRHATGDLVGGGGAAPPAPEADDRGGSASDEPDPPVDPPPPVTEPAPPVDPPADESAPPADEPAPPADPPPGTVVPPREAAPAPLPPAGEGGNPPVDGGGDPPTGQDRDPATEERGGPPAAQGADPGDDPADLAPDSRSLLIAGVLASVLVGALALYRRRKLARRRHRRVITGPADAATEAGLRAAATADVARLDHALRYLSAALADAAHPDPGRRTGGRPDGARVERGAARATGAGSPLPDVGAVWIGEGEIHLILTSPCPLAPPPPFHAAGAGGWFLPADATLPEVTGAMAPLPALVTVGSQPGQHLLVDLERIGMLTVSGPPERTSDLLRYLVAELAHNPWSDRVEVTLAGFPPESARALAGLNPERVTVAESLPAAVVELRRRLAHTTAALADHGLADSVQGRVGDVAADTWTPHLLLVDRPDPEHEPLLAELRSALSATGRRCAVAVATTAPAGARPGRRSIAVTDDGLLKAGFLHDTHAMPAVALPEDLLGPLADLIRGATDHRDHPVPPATEAWAAGTDATGGLHPPPQAVCGSRVAAAPRGGAPAPVAAVAPAGADDPALDELVADWLRHRSQPRIALLGPIQITASGPPPAHRSRVCRELIVYLVARGDRGADAAELDRRLWPDQPVPPAVRTDVITSARRWLGDAPDGEPWLPEATAHGRYRLRDELLVDWHLFRRLRARGERRGLAGADDLSTALQLVRGAPLQDAHQLAGAGLRAPYSWLPGSPVQPELILTGVVDTAHQLADLSLATGDLDTARWAVQQAWLADPHRRDDHPWRDLLRIAHAAGDQAQVRAVVADLLRWRDAEHPDELAPATRQLIHSLLPHAADRPA
jgi:hypothetical protein